jgi:hypothetical protein
VPGLFADMHVRDGNDLRVVVSVSIDSGDQFAALARAGSLLFRGFVG